MINKLQTFITVAELGSFSKASEKLLLSKVSVMKQINTLENETKITLFKRNYKGVELTPAGKSFYISSKEIVKNLEEAITNAQLLQKEQKEVIRIGTSIMRPCNRFINLCSKLGIDKDFSFELIPFNDNEVGFNEILDNLDKSIDCIISPFGSTKAKKNYEFISLGNTSVQIAVPKNHKLSYKNILNWEDLNKESLLLLKEGDSYILDQLRKEILNNHREIRIIDYDKFYDLNTFNQIEENGYLMETLEIWSELHPSIKTIPVNWNYSIPYGLILSKNSSNNSLKNLVKKLITEIEKNPDLLESR